MEGRIIVVGCGAMGLFYATRLTAVGADVVLACRRPEQVEVINRYGVIVEGGGFREEAKVPATLYTRIPRGNVRIVVFAVKAYATEEVARVVKSQLGRRMELVATVQNGIGPLEILEEEFGAERVAALVTYYGAFRVDENRVVFAGGSGVKAGTRGHGVPDALKWLVELIHLSGLDVSVEEDIEPWRWDKLAVNAGINPVTALLGMQNRVVVENSWARSVAVAAAEEAARVAEAYGIKLPRSPVDAVIQTAKATAANKSSMLWDLERGRCTEVDYINGAVVRLGASKGMYTPVNQTLHALIKAYEEAINCRP